MQNLIAATSTTSAEPSQIKDAYDVAHNVALLAAASAQNNDARLHWAEVVRAIESRMFKYTSMANKERRQLPFRKASPLAGSRVPELETIARSLEQVAELTDIVREQVLQQMPLVNSLERNVETLTMRLDASRHELEDAAPRVYHSMRRNYDCLPRTMAARLRCCIVAVVLTHLLLIFGGII